MDKCKTSLCINHLSTRLACGQNVSSQLVYEEWIVDKPLFKFYSQVLRLILHSEMHLLGWCWRIWVHCSEKEAQRMLLSPDSNCQADMIESCGLFSTGLTVRIVRPKDFRKVNKIRGLDANRFFSCYVCLGFSNPVEKSYPQVLQDFAHIMWRVRDKVLQSNFLAKCLNCFARFENS